jgi:hypothetical protein
MAEEHDDSEDRFVHLIKASKDGKARIVGANEWEWFLDFATIKACHSCYEYHIISQILKHNKVSSIIELGTFEGALALYLGVCGLVLDIPVHTFDRDASYSEAAHLDRLGVHFYEMDYLTDEGIEKVKALIDGKPTYLICDGDSHAKAIEFGVYADLIPEGSVISTHDWNTEVRPDDVESVVSRNNLAPFGPLSWTYHSVGFATWRKHGAY